MKNTNRLGPRANNSAVKIIGGIFRVRRDLVGAIKRRVLIDSGLDIEEADLLLDLYGAAELGWQDPKADAQGFVTFRDLQSSLVHSPALLSRRIALLRDRGWIDSCLLHTLKAYQGQVDKKMKAARITPVGKKVIEPVYQKYYRFCEEMVAEYSPDTLRMAQHFLEELLGKVRGEL